MEIEAIADAWYVWVGIAIVSVAVGGVVLSLPSEPPPDASVAANTADHVATSEYGASAIYEHDAESVRIGTRQIALRNDGGIEYASVTFASLTPRYAATGELAKAADALLSGVEPSQFVADDRHFETETQLRDEFRDLRLAVDRRGPTWHETTGKLRVRAVHIADETVVLIEG